MPPRNIEENPEYLGLIAAAFDPPWYRKRYPDIEATKLEPLKHFVRFGTIERRDPNPFFDTAWYIDRYPDVAASGVNPLLHYMVSGATELRSPNPRFDALYYVDRHPDAAANPLLYHLRIGIPQGFATEHATNVRHYLPSESPVPVQPPRHFLDVVIHVGDHAARVRDCLPPLIAGRTLPVARIIVIDDAAADRNLSAWLKHQAAEGEIHLIRNKRRQGFAASAAIGIQAAETHDVVVMRCDTEISAVALYHLAAHAAAHPQVATVSPLITAAQDNGSNLVPLGHTTDQIDAACRERNAGRWVAIPAAVSSCFYVRHDALRAAGGLGDGVASFCQRATRAGWQHHLACDAFAATAPDDNEPGTDARHLALGASNPYRFAITAHLLARSGLPVILMLAHNLGGGVMRHINILAQRYHGHAHVLLLQGTDRGTMLSMPAEPAHPTIKLPDRNIDDLVRVLQSARITRVHIHHLLGLDIDVRRLIQRLAVPFDITVHDYAAICPQANLLRFPSALYCGEPDRAGCNACIAARPQHGAKDIVSWRQNWAWQFDQAERVICPSADVKARLVRYGAGERAIVVPHEIVPLGNWPITIPPTPNQPLRIALIGVLGHLKGARIVASFAETMPPGFASIQVIGPLEPDFPQTARKHVHATGSYQPHELAGLLAKTRPHALWFPSTAPETYSYTLTTAIDSGLPIVATNIGAFPERLAGRPNTWLVDPHATTAQWLEVFETARRNLTVQPPKTPRPTPSIAAESDFYDHHYLSPQPSPAIHRQKPRIVIVPERTAHGDITPSAFIRLLQPLDHPAVSDTFNAVLADAETVFAATAGAEIVITHRAAMPDTDSVDRLAAHLRQSGARLIYDLDAGLSPTHNPVVRRMVQLADAVWVATPHLAAIRPGAVIIENRLDERLWPLPPDPLPYWDDPVRILCMGAGTHDRDFDLIEPVLTRLKADYQDRVLIDIIGMTTPRELPAGLNRVVPPAHAARSYPGFVNWIAGARPVWHIGLAPLLDTPGNRAQSPIRLLDYAALGLATLASDVPAYRDAPAAQHVPNDPNAWYTALEWLVRDQDARRRAAATAHAAYRAAFTLASAPSTRLDALNALRTGANTLTMQHGPSNPPARTRRHRNRGR